MPPTIRTSMRIFCSAGTVRRDSRFSFGSSTLALQGKVELELIQIELLLCPGTRFRKRMVVKKMVLWKLVQNFNTASVALARTLNPTVIPPTVQPPNQH